MSVQRYPLEPEKAGEDYHTKPRLFWAYWLVAAHKDPNLSFVSSDAFRHIQEWPVPDEMIDRDPELRQQLEGILETMLRKSGVCRDEPAALQ
jgi:hypothetical protein